MPKATKKNARYDPDGSKTEHCSICKHFTPPAACSKVSGVISPNGWSKFFSPKK